MRHNSQHTTVGRSDTGDTLGTPVGVVGVCHGGFEGGVVDVSDGRKVVSNKVLCGDVRGHCEGGAAFAVGDGDGERGAVHAVQEDRGCRRIRVRDVDHRDTTFVLFAGVSLKARPRLGTGDELFETREELATVADAEGKCVGTFEEGLEFFTGFFVEED